MYSTSPNSLVIVKQEPKCNDWREGGNVTTDVPVTDGSGLLCYRGTDSQHEVGDRQPAGWQESDD